MNAHRRTPCVVSQMKRRGSYPHPYPTGWYRLMASRSLGCGDLRRIACLGREFIVWRGESGDVHGADLRRSLPTRDPSEGRVVGERIEWPGEGQIAADGTAPPPENAGSSSPVADLVPVRQVHGQIFLFHAGNGQIDEVPPYEVPRIPEMDNGQFLFRGERDGGRVRVHLIEFAENSVDFAPLSDHSRALPHSGYEHPGAGRRHRTQGRLGTRRARPLGRVLPNHAVLRFLGRRIPGAEAKARITFTGPGSVVAFRFAVPGWGDIEMVQTHLPLQPLEQQVHFHWFADRRIPRLLVSYVVGNWIAQWRQDVRIWENKIYRTDPALSSADGPIFRMRRWYRQFLPAQPDCDAASGGGSRIANRTSADHRPEAAVAD